MAEDVVIVVRGGIVGDVYSDAALGVVLVDFDNYEVDPSWAPERMPAQPLRDMPADVRALYEKEE